MSGDQAEVEKKPPLFWPLNLLPGLTHIYDCCYGYRHALAVATAVVIVALGLDMTITLYIALAMAMAKASSHLKIG